MAFDRYASQGRLIELAGRNRLILDVGCAQGAVASELVKNGCRVIGLEFDSAAAALAGAVCEEVLVCDVEKIESLPFSDGYFDVVLFGDIFEHLRDPGRVLQRLARYLKKDGIVVASTPNIANWGVRFQLLLGRFDYYERNWVIIWDHVRFFTFRSFADLFHRAQFDVRRVDVTPGLHLCKAYEWLLGRWLCRLRGYGWATYHLCRVFKGLLAHQIVLVAQKRSQEASPRP